MSNPEPLSPYCTLRVHLIKHLSGYLIAGILVTGPTALTLYLIWTFVRFIDSSVGTAFLRNIIRKLIFPFIFPVSG